MQENINSVERSKMVSRVPQQFSGQAGRKEPAQWLRVIEFSAKYGCTQETARRWAKEGRVQYVRIPNFPRGRIFILDPEWIQIDRPDSSDPAEWLCVLRQCDVARLLNVTPRALRYMEAAGKTRYRMVGHRKLYALCEIRRLLSERQSGHKKVGKSERREALLRWAKSKLQSPPSR